jgi:uncharacterized membrane protein (DUF373 family)
VDSRIKSLEESNGEVEVLRASLKESMEKTAASVRAEMKSAAAELSAGWKKQASGLEKELSAELRQQAVQALFAGVLLVVLGLELMDTLRNYFIEHRLRVEFLISVALIAVARHVIQLDYEHASPWLVIAIALLTFSLAASYVGVRKVEYRARSSPDRP